MNPEKATVPASAPALAAVAAVLALLAGVPGPAHAADVIVTGEVVDWLGEADLAQPHTAGSDLADEQLSDPDEVILDVVNTGGAQWELWMNRDCQPGEWPSAWNMYQRRTSANTDSPGSVWGGTDWTGPIGESQIVFLEGEGNVSEIEVQFKYTGVSLYNVPDTAECQIDYTLEVLN